MLRTEEMAEEIGVTETETQQDKAEADKVAKVMLQLLIEID
jgi:hypothetical protein